MFAPTDISNLEINCVYGDIIDPIDLEEKEI